MNNNNAIVQSNESFELTFNKSLNSFYGATMQVDTLKDLGVLWRHIDSVKDSYNTFASIQPTLRRVDGIRYIASSTANNTGIVLLTELQPTDSILWTLKLYRYQNVGVNNVNIGTFETVTYKGNTLYVLVDHANDYVKLVQPKWTDELYSDMNDTAIVQYLSIDNILKLAGTMQGKYVNMATNGQSTLIRASKNQVQSDERNTVYNAYLAMKAEQRTMSRI